MKMTLSTIDAEIRELENRIAAERMALDDAVHDCAHSLRQAVTSPGALLAVAGVGFTVGKVMFRRKPKPAPVASAAAKKAGALGFLGGVAGTALSLASSRWGSLATWALRRYFAQRKGGTDEMVR